MRRAPLLAPAALVLAAALASAVLAAAPAQPSFQEVEESLTCQCGCGLTVHSCNHLQCGSALPLREEIRSQMAEGKDKGTILDYFKQKYGEKILSSPTTTGFNLAAWVTPFVMVAVGALLIAFTIRRWGGQRAPSVSTVPPLSTSTSREHQKILERELENFDK